MCLCRFHEQQVLRQGVNCFLRIIKKGRLIFGPLRGKTDEECRVSRASRHGWKHGKTKACDDLFLTASSGKPFAHDLKIQKHGSFLAFKILLNTDMVPEPFPDDKGSCASSETLTRKRPPRDWPLQATRIKLIIPDRLGQKPFHREPVSR